MSIDYKVRREKLMEGKQGRAWCAFFPATCR